MQEENAQSALDMTVTFYVTRNCPVTLHYPDAFSLPLSMLKEFFRCMCFNKPNWPYYSKDIATENARIGTEKALKEAVATAESMLHHAQRCYDESYVSIDGHTEYVPEQKKKQTAINRSVTLDLEHAKREYDRLLKVQKYYIDIREKYN